MTASNTGRFAIYEWGSSTDPFTRDQMTASHQVLKQRAAGFATSEESQPDTDLNGYFYYTSTNGSAGTLKYSNGVDWFPINEAGSVVALDGTGSDGSGAAFARANHKHALNDGFVTTATIVDGAVTTAKLANAAVLTANLADTSVTNAKIASGLDASKLTAGTLPMGRIAAGDITNTKLGTDLNAEKLTAGTLPIARIAANTVTVDKLGQVAAHGVLARVAGTTGNLSSLTASTNQVLGRGASGNLTFAKVSTGQIATGAVTDALLASTGLDISKFTVGVINSTQLPPALVGNTEIATMAANTVKVNATGSVASPTDLTISSNRVLGRGPTGNLISTQVTSGMIANGAVTLGTTTTGNYVGVIAAGKVDGVDGIDVANGSGSEAATVTITHHNTSNQASINNSNGYVIQDISLDTYGHVTSLASANLDSRYYTEEEINTKLSTVYGSSSSSAGLKIWSGTGNPPSNDSYANGTIYLKYT
jgi:hypothetical protein